jgi:hypothetical protein
VLVERSSFSGFTATGTGGFLCFVLEAASTASLTLKSSVVANNIFGSFGSALRVSGSASLTLEASTLYENIGTAVLGVWCTGSSTCTVRNSVVWDTSILSPARVWGDSTTVLTVTYSDIKADSWGSTFSNIQLDPGFSGAQFPNFLPGINLIGKGDPNKDPANPLDFAGNERVQGATQDIGAFEAPGEEWFAVEAGTGRGLGRETCL